MTEFEIKAIELLTDISARLQKIEEIAEKFDGRFERTQAAQRQAMEMSLRTR